MESFFEHPQLTFALAMAFGVLAQGLARHALLPGIVLLLAVGIALGPDGANIIRPHTMGDALPAVVGMAVAVILFEGGLNLEIRVLRRQARSIRRLITIGAIITAVGGALACRAILGWDWRLSALFGTLVIVTGPTVITPLVRRLRLDPDVATILEAEGVFIDAVGATIAVVALELALAPSGEALGEAALGVALRFLAGGAIGAAGGFVLVALLRPRHIVPHGLENILVLAMAIALFEISNALVGESGITAAIAAGVVVGNVRSRALDEIADFKEQLTVLLVATLFVLLAADVRLADVQALGWPGVATVLALMLFVRPATVFASTYGTGIPLRSKLFLSWLAPRGIVAAAVASLFAVELARAGFEGGTELRALVFLVIGITVTVQGLSGGPVARLLGVRLPERGGYVFLGANPLARHLASRLAERGDEVLVVDSNADECRAAEEAGHKVLYGNGLDRRTLLRARLHARRACVAITPNESVNLLFARLVLEESPGAAAYVAIDADRTGVTTEMVRKIDATALFGGTLGLGEWIQRWRRGQVELVRRAYAPDGEGDPAPFAAAPGGVLLPLLVDQNGSRALLDDTTRLRHGDVIEFAVFAPRRDEAHRWLDEAGWKEISAT